MAIREYGRVDAVNVILRKTQSLCKRLETGVRVILTPENFYLYPKNIYLYHTPSYSQEGEDLILARFFGDKASGFYVDVGAHHPQRFSNTYYFYLKGWRGINIDAMPGSMKLFEKIRPYDINLEIPISDGNQILTYYEFNEPALNGFCEEISNKRDGLRDYKIIAQRELQTRTLYDVLEEHMPYQQEIDFLSVDVEGLDLQVLKSNDWVKYRPRVILVEELSRTGLCQQLDSELYKFLCAKDYQLYAKSVNTLFFTRNA